MVQNICSDAEAAYLDFDNHGNMESLDQAISKYEIAANMTPEGDSGLPPILGNLGAALLRRFEQLGRAVDMSKGIERLEMAVNLTPDRHPDKSACLDNLGNSLQTRFEQFGNLSDLDSAITKRQLAVNLIPDGHPEKAMCLNNFGTSLQSRFERLGNLSDLDTAISQKQLAVNLAPDRHPDKPMFLDNLGNSLSSRFERLGNISDLDTAIARQQSAVNLTPNKRPHKPMYLNNLGTSLQSRFVRLGDVSDIDSAIIQHQLAVNLVLDGHPDKPMYLNNLGASFQRRFEWLENVSDLDSAITQQQLAVNLAPDGYPLKPGYLSNLGASLAKRFNRIGNICDLDSAITHKQLAVSLTPDGHPEKPMLFNNLGNSLQSRFLELGNLSDIDSSIIQKQSAVNLTPEEHPHKSNWLTNLGSSFLTRFRHFHHPHDAEAAITHLSTSAKSSIGPPTVRLKAVRGWISLASQLRHHSLLSAYECAIELMPLIAWLGLPIRDRHKHLVEIGGIARDAAAAAISLEQYDKALEWLEQGRSIVWNQILQLRTPVDELRTVNSNLANRLLRVSRLLDRGFEDKRGSRSAEEDAQQYRALVMEWESILEEIRCLPSFEDFLRPLTVSRLRDVSQNGPVVVVNIAKERCDALALVAGIDDVIHIPLPNVTSKGVTELRDELKDLLYTDGIRLRGERAAQKWTDEDSSNDCRHILAELWVGLVKPVLDSLAFSVRPINPFIFRLLTILSRFIQKNSLVSGGVQPALLLSSPYMLREYMIWN
jgi:tetratricopeptide (TPR) repeat protein